MTCTQPGAELQLKESCGILVWTFASMMHPEAILESPFEVACFRFSPVTPGLVAGGCETGQIVIWNCSEVGLLRIMGLFQPMSDCLVSQFSIKGC